MTVLDRLAGGLVVSCQAPAGHALRDGAVLARLARAAVDGGAVGIRCGGVGGAPDVAAVRRAVRVPVIGLTKDGDGDVYITPTLRSVAAVVDAGAEVVAVQATGPADAARPDGSTLADLVGAAHRAGRAVMADVSTLDEAVAAAGAGCDAVGTTMAGYTRWTRDRVRGPDLDLLTAVRAALPQVFLVAEGRYHTPDDVRAAFDRGADTVVVGTAITDVSWVTARFAAAAAGRG
ncbi:N-acetylmannosamine-6-phosphate 2-epimerase [Nakamurella endophytica]|uniref:N-acylglucosamine-6-phosphate 2-epimerase n=1 Tax=Nakamurella endophytica TaxID=1748367 RepID=A0A917TAC4_9ACTN|nr:putative N-acetylmannosamine-6-phosphate 2-epimerase [Nakamurella endophytica]GGM15021.1 putative N-acetylmannosamine-6-phosphate 2-epimerase [Nakamurella endophytica]